MKILLIEDSSSYRLTVQSMLKKRADVFAVDAPSLAFKILKNENIDIIICDYLLPEMNGLEVLAKVKQEYPNIEIVMVSSSGDMDTVIGALRKGAADFLKKPFTAAELWVSLERTKKFSDVQTDLSKYKKKNQHLNEAVNSKLGFDFVGKSRSILEIKNQMNLVAQTPDTSVLLLGESGTGKELIARGIHNMSARSEELFGAVNMSAVPESLFESEFFGHKKGSFTGAIADKAGWFETIDKGSLFFDEIGEMSLSLQVKLLRVLEDRNFTKVGTHREEKFDIRIIAATNKSIDDLTQGKQFRTDLFHRLGTFIIQIPPLRERISDIPELTYHFLHTLNKRMGKNITQINDEVFAFLSTYAFPGNIRELKNMVERAIIICQTNELTPEHFTLLNSNSPCSINNHHEATFDLKKIEKQTITEALKQVDFNKSEAAKLLNLEWNALYRRIKKHNIELPEEI